MPLSLGRKKGQQITIGPSIRVHIAGFRTRAIGRFGVVLGITAPRTHPIVRGEDRDAYVFARLLGEQPVTPAAVSGDFHFAAIERLQGQKVWIGNDIELVVTSFEQPGVHIAILAPRSLRIMRGELVPNLEIPCPTPHSRC